MTSCEIHDANECSRKDCSRSLDSFCEEDTTGFLPCFNSDIFADDKGQEFALAEKRRPSYGSSGRPTGASGVRPGKIQNKRCKQKELSWCKWSVERFSMNNPTNPYIRAQLLKICKKKKFAKCDRRYPVRR